MKYPNIEKHMGELPRTVIFGDARDFVLMSDLEAILAKGVEVYGVELTKQYLQRLGTVSFEGQTHSGLLIGYKPIESQEPVSKSEIEKFINDSSAKFNRYEYVDFLKLILKNGVRND